MDDLRTRYWNLDDVNRPTRDAWVTDWQAVADRTEKAHPLYQRADPDCDECGGSSRHLITYNPNSHWGLVGNWTAGTDGWAAATG